MASLVSLSLALDDGSADFYKSVGGPIGNITLLTDAAQTAGAKCLDGTPGAYYFAPGSGDGANKWYMHHQGGGWCESMDDCLGRSQGDLGSSKNYPASTDLGGGYFDNNPKENPMMYNWNKVFMRYCDGGSFAGNNENVAAYKNTSLYFRGKRVREAIAHSLFETRDLAKATDVVISGCSAGGLATFLHTDQWCDALKAANPAAKCVGLPDSGFFLDYQSADAARGGLGSTKPGNYHAGLKWVFETFNSTAGVNQDCINAHGTGGPGAATDSDTYLCQFAEHTSVFTHTPMFAMQSEYDSWQTGNVLHPGDSVQTLGDNVTKRMQANLFGPHPQSGAFLDSCHHHCGAWNQIRIDGDLISDAFAKWYDGLGKPGNKAVWNQAPLAHLHHSSTSSRDTRHLFAGQGLPVRRVLPPRRRPIGAACVRGDAARRAPSCVWRVSSRLVHKQGDHVETG